MGKIMKSEDTVLESNSTILEDEDTDGMREPTEQERNSVNAYIAMHSKDLGVKFFDDEDK